MALLGVPAVKDKGDKTVEPWEALAEALLGRHPLTCPNCGAEAMSRLSLPRLARVQGRPPPWQDSS